MSVTEPDRIVRAMRRHAPVPVMSVLVLVVSLLSACTSSTVTPSIQPISSAPTATPSAAPTMAPVMSPPTAAATASVLPTPSAAPPSSSSPSPSTAPVGSVPQTIDPELAARLQAAVDAARADIPAPGLSVAVRLANGELWTGVSGSASLQPERPVTPDTVFAVASVTKTFVTALILQLSDEGALLLDDRLARYLPDFPRARQITIRQLLSHTSGVYNYFESPRYLREVFADPGRRWSFQEILGFVGAPYCAPGRCFHYSNTNFVLLGRVAEEASGSPVATEIKRRFIDPLSLTNTVFQPDQRTPADRAHGYLSQRGGGFVDHTRSSRVIPHLSAVTVAWAAAAMASTPSDLARWASALYGGQVLSPASTALMLTFRPVDDYGLGTRVRDFGPRQAVGHLGGIRGFSTAMWHFPAEGFTVVVCENLGMVDPNRPARLIVRTLTGFRS